MRLSFHRISCHKAAALALAALVEIVMALVVPVAKRWTTALTVGDALADLDDDLFQVVCAGEDPSPAQLTDALRRALATVTTAVVPYFGYARQDRKDEGRVPITAKLVANLITTAGADRVLAIDLHAHHSGLTLTE